MTMVEPLTADELHADNAWWRIYQDSFPAREREPAEVIVESLRRGIGMAFCARAQGVTCGLASTHLLKDPPAVFLVYLAVASDDRSKGIGKELLTNAWEAGAARLRAEGRPPLGLIWEVDPPGPAAGSDAHRRIAFFERNGGYLLEPPYLQPPVDGVAAVPMRLMFRPSPGQGIPPPATMDALVRALYFEKYEALNRIDRSLLDDLLSRNRDS